MVREKDSVTINELQVGEGFYRNGCANDKVHTLSNGEGMKAGNKDKLSDGNGLTTGVVDDLMRKRVLPEEYSDQNGYSNGHSGLEEAQSCSSVKEEAQTNKKKRKKRCCPRGPGVWCKKYFWEGQELKKPMTPEQKKLIGMLPLTKRILIKYRRIIAFGVPALFFHFFWWGIMIKRNLWGIFPDKYPMTITMIAGSIIAGMTSEGGGAVAFPVMTLVLDVDPSIARDFALMIQSCGMSAAAFAIFFMRVRVEWNSLILSSLGGLGGIIFGLHIVDPALSPPVKKLGFVSIWFAFASVLIFLNRTAKRRTFKTIPEFNWWKGSVLFLCGVLGGIFTSFSGSGLDICSFMILTLLFRISEKVATPTSVILMAFNSLIGFYWRGVMLEAVSQDAWEYFAACLPIVVFGAPIGSVLGSHFHRLVLAALVIILDTIALVTAFAIIRPLTPPLIGGCIAVIVGCFGIFMGLTFTGQKLLDLYEEREAMKMGSKKSSRSGTVSSISSRKSSTSSLSIDSAESKPVQTTSNGHVNPAFTPDGKVHAETRPDHTYL